MCVHDCGAKAEHRKCYLSRTHAPLLNREVVYATEAVRFKQEKERRIPGFEKRRERFCCD